MKFAEKNKMSNENIGEFLLEVDRLKSEGKLSDGEIIIKSYKKIKAKNETYFCPKYEK